MSPNALQHSHTVGTKNPTLLPSEPPNTAVQGTLPDLQQDHHQSILNDIETDIANHDSDNFNDNVRMADAGATAIDTNATMTNVTPATDTFAPTYQSPTVATDCLTPSPTNADSDTVVFHNPSLTVLPHPTHMDPD